MAIIVDTAKIKSKNLNVDVFGQFKHEGLDFTNTDKGLIKSLRARNQEPVETKNLSFNFDLVCMNNGPLPAIVDEAAGDTYTPGHEVENYEQIFRIYDDCQVLGFIVDMFGVDRAGMSANAEMMQAGQPGAFSEAVSIRVKILGNFTKLDDELGYPAVYKSTEFNLVEDFILSFSDNSGYAQSTTLLSAGDAMPMGADLLSNGEYLSDGVTTRRDPRQTFFPVDPDKHLMILQGGAEYIISITPFMENGAPETDEDHVYAYHMITSLQINLVCQSFRRRFA